MSQQVKTNVLEFMDKNRNVKGTFNPQRIMVEYNFTELALDNTNKYTPTTSAGASVALGSGGLLLTTDTDSGDTAVQSQGGIWWYPAKNPVVEMKFKLDVITTVAIFAGFSDAVTEAAGTLPHGISTATQTATATDSAGFLFDTNQTLAYFNTVWSKAGPTKGFTQLASTKVPVAATDLTLRTEIDTLGNIRYYWNGTQVGYKATGVTTTTPLIPFFGIKNNAAAAHVATLRYVRAWQDA